MININDTCQTADIFFIGNVGVAEKFNGVLKLTVTKMSLRRIP